MVPFAAAFVCPSMPVLDPAAATILVVEDEPTVCELAAEALLDAAENYAREAGAVRLVLQTARDNAPAQRLYERRGWVRDDAFATYELAV